MGLYGVSGWDCMVVVDGTVWWFVKWDRNLFMHCISSTKSKMSGME